MEQDWKKRLDEAVKQSNKEEVRKIISKEAKNDWLFALEAACRENNKEIAELSIQRGATKNGMFLESAAKICSIEFMEWLLGKAEGDLSWHEVFVKALGSDNKSLAKSSIEKGEINLDRALQEACEAGDEEMVNFIIEEGAKDWKIGFKGACLGMQKKIAQMMLEKGVDTAYGKPAREYFKEKFGEYPL